MSERCGAETGQVDDMIICRSILVATIPVAHVKRSRSQIAQRLELEWVILDEETHTTIAYFYNERNAIIAARALNKVAKKSATRKL